MRYLALAAAALVAFIWWLPIEPEYEMAGPIPIIPITAATTSTTTTTTTVPKPVTTTAPVIRVDTTTTTLPGFETARCPQWWPLALEVGWPANRLEVLDDIMYDESRCTDVVSDTGDYGLLQINRRTWKSYYESFGHEWETIRVPVLNLWTGLQIAEKAIEAGWRWCSPWDASEVRPCSL